MPSRFILIALAAIVAGLPARAETVAPPDGLVVDIGAMVFSIPRLTVEGGTLTGAELARLADPKDKTPLDERLARVTAKRIVIPEIRGESKAGERSTRVVYRDVVLEDIANGRVGALRAASWSKAPRGPAAPSRRATRNSRPRASIRASSPMFSPSRAKATRRRPRPSRRRPRSRASRSPSPTPGSRYTPDRSRRLGCARALSPSRRWPARRTPPLRRIKPR